uniref:HL07915p n=1 Tax=Drosophila melanogaster TaxID=7227 RepID=Q8SXN6_DROME|nr:HL07915p [Drosophila melanogaster]
MGSGSELPLRICMVWLVAGLAIGEALRCYECVDQETSCGSADNSPGRVRECPNSTMCSTTMLTTMVNGNEWIRVRRGCAKQVDYYFDYIGKHWEQKYRLMDLPEGCKKENGRMNCNCRGELCNSGSHSTPNFRLPFVLILLALVCGKILLPV